MLPFHFVGLKYDKYVIIGERYFGCLRDLRFFCCFFFGRRAYKISTKDPCCLLPGIHTLV